MSVASLDLFGPVARGKERDDSDIGILVAFDGPATFDQYMDVEMLLEEASLHRSRRSFVAIDDSARFAMFKKPH